MIINRYLNVRYQTLQATVNKRISIIITWYIGLYYTGQLLAPLDTTTHAWLYCIPIVQGERGTMHYKDFKFSMQCKYFLFDKVYYIIIWSIGLYYTGQLLAPLDATTHAWPYCILILQGGRGTMQYRALKFSMQYKYFLLMK